MKTTPETYSASIYDDYLQIFINSHYIDDNSIKNVTYNSLKSL